jgi:hypothetical protein
MKFIVSYTKTSEFEIEADNKHDALAKALAVDKKEIEKESNGWYFNKLTENE